jgi:hypothetical protein
VRCENIFDIDIGSEFHDYIAYVNFTSILYEGSPPFSLLNCDDIISRNVVSVCKSQKNKRKQMMTRTGHCIQNTDKACKQQMKSQTTSETNERKTDLSSNLHFFSKV